MSRQELAAKLLTALERERLALGVDEWDESDPRALDYLEAWETLGEYRAYEVINAIGPVQRTIHLVDVRPLYDAASRAASGKGGWLHSLQAALDDLDAPAEWKDGIL